METGPSADGWLEDTRASYNTVADRYADLTRHLLDETPEERALLAMFADMVRAQGGGTVADVGCGAGRITAHLRQLGVDAFGPAPRPRRRRPADRLLRRPGRVWNPPMPLLFQRSIGSENRPFTPSAVRKLLINALAATGLTDAIMNGLPPHIAQVICGHKTTDTTIGYKKPRELHQTGAKPQAAWSGAALGGLREAWILAA